MAAAAHSWHRGLKTGKQRNEFLFKNEIMSDCSFLVIERTTKTTIPAHKYILGVNSEEFYNLFYLMQTSNEIPIEDTSVEILTKFLEFLYTEKTTLTMANVGDLIKLSKRYSVCHLEEFCGEYLSRNINKQNALSVLEKYAEQDMPNLVNKCMELISPDQLIFESPSFLKISIRTLTELLKSDGLKGFKEITIFNGVNKWSENFCHENNQIINSANKRSAVGPALEFIRFASMPLNDFTLCTLNNPILNPAECLEIYQSIGSGGESECKFSNKERQSDIQIFKILKNNDLTTKIPLNLNEHSIIRSFEFSVNKPIAIHGFGILGRTEKKLNQKNPEVLVIQLRDYKKTVLLESKVTIHYDGTGKTYDLVFNESMFLKPNEVYTICFYNSDRKFERKLYEYHISTEYVKFNQNFDEVLFSLDTEANIFFKTIIFSKFSNLGGKVKH